MEEACLWPLDGEPKTLIAVRVNCKADDLFRTLWVMPDLQAQLHKLRNDNNLVETPWLASRDKLPAQQYTWEKPDEAGAGKNIVASNRWRKVRFESPPAAMATKPFQNEEVQHCVDYRPGRRYCVEAQANTSAPYGDKFDLFFRITILAAPESEAPGGSACFLQVVFTIQWSPSMNRMMKGMVSKAVEGGVRGTYKTYRQVLDTFHPSTDVPEATISARDAEVLSEEPSAGVAVAPAAVVKEEAVDIAQARDQVGHYHPGAGRPMPNDFLSHAFGQLVWGDQVAALSGAVGVGLQSAASEGTMARALAALVTLSLVHTAVSMLHSVQAFCAAKRGVLWLLCLPITHVIDVPDSVTEVLTSLALVAAINWLVICAAQASVSQARRGMEGEAGIGRAGAGKGASQAAASKPAARTAAANGPGAEPAGAPATGAGGAASAAPAAPAAEAAPAKPAVPASSGASGSSSTPPVVVSKRGPMGGGQPIPIPVPPKGSATSAKGPVSASSANAAGSAAAAKASTSGAAAGGGGPTSGPPSSRENSRSATPVRPGSVTAPGVRAVPAQMEMTSMSSSAGSASAKSGPAAAGAGSASAAAAGGAEAAAGSAAAADMGLAAVGFVGAENGAILPPATAAGSVTGTAILSPTNSTGSAAFSQRVGSPSGTGGGGLSSAMEGMVGAGGPGGMVPGPGGTMVYGMGSPMYHGGDMANGPEPMKAWLKSMSSGFDSMAESFKGAFFAGPTPAAPTKPAMGGVPEGDEAQPQASPRGLLSSDSLRSAGAAASAGVLSPGSNAGTDAATALALSVAALAALEDGEPDAVEEEMFENERFQPFRGWGHTWPGHFLPSDRVGHWGDRNGKPGGTASMVFEQVEPALPDGWRWVEAEWQLDMEGLERECVDENGWTYALDFNYLKYPPPPSGGKCTLKHFVRRRRWVRSRARIASERILPVPLPQQMSKEDEEGQGEQQEGQEGAVEEAAPASAAAGSAQECAATGEASTGVMQAQPSLLPVPARHEGPAGAHGHGHGHRGSGSEQHATGEAASLFTTSAPPAAAEGSSSGSSSAVPAPANGAITHEQSHSEPGQLPSNVRASSSGKGGESSSQEQQPLQGPAGAAAAVKGGAGSSSAGLSEGSDRSSGEAQQAAGNDASTAASGGDGLGQRGRPGLGSLPTAASNASWSSWQGGEPPASSMTRSLPSPSNSQQGHRQSGSGAAGAAGASSGSGGAGAGSSASSQGASTPSDPSRLSQDAGAGGGKAGALRISSSSSLGKQVGLGASPSSSSLLGHAAQGVTAAGGAGAKAGGSGGIVVAAEELSDGSPSAATGPTMALSPSGQKPNHEAAAGTGAQGDSTGSGKPGVVHARQASTDPLGGHLE